jgi:hypothetical protein
MNGVVIMFERIRNPWLEFTLAQKSLIVLLTGTTSPLVRLTFFFACTKKRRKILLSPVYE